MNKGFIFNDNLCVNCKACSAACVLENKWNIPARNIFTFNSGASPVLPLINLSLACNHCESAICMNGCPGSAYSRDNVTGAIILESSACIGCRYCQWNCPYDAPKYDDIEKVIVKCNLCNTIVKEGGAPVCVLACPTGALNFGELHGAGEKYQWFPDKNINPSIEFVSVKNGELLEIIPGRNYKAATRIKENINIDISLIIFSFLSTLSVAGIISSFFNGKIPEIKWLILIIAAGISSVFHLGRKLRLWRALSNQLRSPLSNEIAAYIIFSLFTFFSIVLQNPVLLIISSFTGIVFLLSVDRVYLYSDRSATVILHCGQTFLSSLIIISFLTGNLTSFVFVAVLKIVSTVYMMNRKKPCFTLRFLRIALLLVVWFSLILFKSYNDGIVILIFFIGELIDRILFYNDFKPLNITNLISKQINT